MERQREDDEWQTDSGESRMKRPYSSPELQEWGSIQDLTQGGVVFGKGDFPLKGGSRPT